MSPSDSTTPAMPPATMQAHLGDILSVTTGCLLSPTGVGGVYRLLNWMTQDNLYTHQLGRVAQEVTPHILAKHPKLATVDASGVTPENWRTWLADQVLAHGEYLEVAQLPPGEHYYIDPVSELVEKGVHPSRIAVVHVVKGDRNA